MGGKGKGYGGSEGKGRVGDGVRKGEERRGGLGEKEKGREGKGKGRGGERRE